MEELEYVCTSSIISAIIYFAGVGDQLNAMEGILAGALRREQEAESSQKRLAAEIEQLTRLVSTEHASLCHLDDGHQVPIFPVEFVDFSDYRVVFSMLKGSFVFVQVKQREDDTQCSKMMLRFREDKIKRLESLSAGFLTAELYLMQEKNTLVEELQLLQAKIDRNPELTRFAMENIRLLEQLRRLPKISCQWIYFHLLCTSFP